MLKPTKLIKMLSLLLPILTLLIIPGCVSEKTLENDAETNIRFGAEVAKSGLWKEAIFRWEYALKMKPNDARIHNNLAVAYENEGDYDKAEYHYKKAVELDPENEAILTNYNNFKGFLKKIYPENKQITRGEENANKK